MLIFTAMTVRSWAGMSHLLRILCVWAIVSGIAALVFQMSGIEIIEFDSTKLTIRKEIHGWGRKREYKVEECRESEWMQGAEGTPSVLRCKTGSRTIRFGDNISDDQALQILTALQQTLPQVAEKLCSYPGGNDHFISLGLQ